MLHAVDIWRGVIVKRPATELTGSDLNPENMRWLPSPGRFKFRADPFGIWRDNHLHVFVELFDYRTARGTIELLVYDEHLDLLHTEVVLSRPWHLSYPFLIEEDGECWMLPEARRSGELTLYRADSFPRRWKAAATFDIGAVVDATPLLHEGRWWLFYSQGSRRDEQGFALSIAYADHITGPWRPHPLNPVRRGLSATRPGGTPLIGPAGEIHLPMQDCRDTYGGALRRLVVRRLDERHFEAEEFDWLSPSPELAPYSAGIHTLSAAGEVTLLDCKLIDRSAGGTLAWRCGRLARRWRDRAARRQ